MLHIVFNEADVKVLQDAIELDASLDGEVLQVKDDFAVGPLADIYSDEGMSVRRDWWREILSGGDYDGHADNGMVDDNKTVLELKERLSSNENEVAWVWAAQNKHDVCGYYWLVGQMKDFAGRVFILYMNNLPFINEKGNIFYPEWLSQIPAREFLKAKKLAREVTPSEFEVDPDEWKSICNENRGVRLLEGGKKLVQEDYDFYDAELKKHITGDWQKASKIIHHYLSKSKNNTGDAYLLWRLKVMLGGEGFNVQGNPGLMKEFEIKLPAKTLSENA